MKKIEEIMALVSAYGDACEAFGDYQFHENAMDCVKAKAAIESALRELVERKPLSDEVIGEQYLEEYSFDGECAAFRAGVRYAERAHGIGA